MDSYEAFKTITSETINPRQFLRYSFDIDNLADSEALEEETSFGYCTKCVRLLSKILGFQKKTIREWGYNPNFDYMPPHAKLTCTYAQLALSKIELNKMNHQGYEAPKITPKQFIQEILLKDLSSEEKLRIISSTKFRSQYLNLLSKTLKVSKITIYQWGHDIELKNMPKHYHHTLAYALAVYKKRQKADKKMLPNIQLVK